MHERKAIVIYEEDSATTIMKPFSEEHFNYLIVVNEDAYGEMTGILVPKSELKFKLNLCDEEFEKMVNKL